MPPRCPACSNGSPGTHRRAHRRAVAVADPLVSSARTPRGRAGTVFIAEQQESLHRSLSMTTTSRAGSMAIWRRRSRVGRLRRGCPGGGAGVARARTDRIVVRVGHGRRYAIGFAPDSALPRPADGLDNRPRRRPTRRGRIAPMRIPTSHGRPRSRWPHRPSRAIVAARNGTRSSRPSPAASSDVDDRQPRRLVRRHARSRATSASLAHRRGRLGDHAHPRLRDRTDRSGPHGRGGRGRGTCRLPALPDRLGGPRRRSVPYAVPRPCVWALPIISGGPSP